MVSWCMPSLLPLRFTRRSSGLPRRRSERARRCARSSRVPLPGSCSWFAFACSVRRRRPAASRPRVCASKAPHSPCASHSCRAHLVRGHRVVSVTGVRRGARTGEARLRVRPPVAFGQGDVVGHLLLGPTCPVERANDPCDPVARPDPVTLPCARRFRSRDGTDGHAHGWQLRLLICLRKLHGARRTSGRGIPIDPRCTSGRDERGIALASTTRDRCPAIPVSAEPGRERALEARRRRISPDAPPRHEPPGAIDDAPVTPATAWQRCGRPAPSPATRLRRPVWPGGPGSIEVGGGQSPPGAEPVAERVDLCDRCRDLEPPDPLDRAAEREVGGGPDVGPAQREHQHSVGGEPADALDLVSSARASSSSRVSNSSPSSRPSTSRSARSCR